MVGGKRKQKLILLSKSEERMKFLTVIFCLFFSALLSFAQTDIRVESFVIDGELTKDDPISDGLGRINAIELNLQKGDKLYSTLTADFIPMLVLTAPSGEYKVNYPDEESLMASYETTINESGRWLLLVVGDSTDSGAYTLSNKYASASSLEFDKSGDYCKNIELLKNHLKADFHFLKGDLIDEEDVVYSSKVDFPGVKIATIEGLGNEIFKTKLYDGDDKSKAEIIFNETVASLSVCLEDWNKKINPWKKVFGSDNQQIKTGVYTFDTEYENSISVVLNEGKLNSESKYELEVIISKD